LNTIKKSIESKKNSIRSLRARSHYLFCLKTINDELIAGSHGKN